MTEVSGRTAFITGAASGIGLGIARAFAGAGAKIALADIDHDGLTRARAELSKVTAVQTVTLDVRDREAYARAADMVEDVLGPVSLLFNNAGVAGAAPVDRLTYELWDWALGINLGGVVNGVQTFLPRMLERGGGGHIVNTASGAGLVGRGTGVLYHTAKFGVVGMAESLYGELMHAGIGVSVLCPGPVATSIVDTTLRSRPGGTPAEDGMEGRNARTRAMIAQGVPADAVGLMVLEAVKAGRLFILTDRIMIQPVEERTAQILAAAPPA